MFTDDDIHISSWCVLRCQTLDQQAPASQPHTQQVSQTPVFEVSEWCDDADDWGDEVHVAEAEPEPITEESRDRRTMTYADVTNMTSVSDSKRDDVITSSGGDLTQVDDVTAEEMRSESPIDAIATISSSDIDSNSLSDQCIAEEITLPKNSNLGSVLKFKNLNVTETQTCPSTSPQQLKAYYLSAFDEPDAEDCQQDDHVTGLLEQYQMREGFDVENLSSAKSR